MTVIQIISEIWALRAACAWHLLRIYRLNGLGKGLSESRGIKQFLISIVAENDIVVAVWCAYTVVLVMKN